MKRTVGATLAFGLLTALWGCPPPPPPPPPPKPTPTPSFQPLPLPSGGAYSDAGIEIAGGNLVVQAAAGGQPLAGALVKVYGPTLAAGETGARGTVALGPLEPGTTYRVVVQGPGYATYQAGNIVIEKDKPTPVTASLVPGATVVGTVKAGGKAVAGAVVSDGLNAALTDAQGQFRLEGAARGQVQLSVSKPRFKTAQRTLSVGSAGATGMDMVLENAEPVVYFDPRVAPGIGSDKFNGLRQVLSEAGWRVSDQAPGGAEGAWVLTSPVTELSAEVRAELSAFVSRGGKLVVFGEWGGFNGHKTPSSNAVLHGFGLHVNPDLVRDPAAGPDMGWLNVVAFHPDSPAVSGVKNVSFYRSASVFHLPGQLDLAQTAATAYRVQANAVAGAQSLVAGGAFAGGKAIVSGDASAWSDEDTDADGVANLREADNARLVTQLFDW